MKRPLGFPVWSGLAAAFLIQRPFFIAGVGVYALAVQAKKRRSVTAEKATVPEHQALLARIVLVGLSAGIPMLAALELALGYVSGEVAHELGNVLRSARRYGLAAALTNCGPLVRPLLSRLTLAVASGAPVTEAMAGYLSELRQERRTVALERVRRLPVTLMIPLGLLILPGFVVLFVGPIVYRSLSDLVVSLP